MTRIDPSIRKFPHPADVKATGPRISRQKRQRMTADQEYNAISDVYKEQNPQCLRCGYTFVPAGLQTDHIVSGTAGRAASLLNSDTWINQCPVCHGKAWSQAEKAAAKLMHVLATIERLRCKNFSAADERLILKAIRNRKPGHVR